MKWYLAGPMTGIPQFNFPAVDTATQNLRAAGYDIITPHEQDSPAVQAAAWASPDGKLIAGQVAGETWGQILARDVRIIADDVGGIIHLPGWTKSNGALLETVVGLLCHRKFMRMDSENLPPVPVSAVVIFWCAVAGLLEKIR